jgi:Fe-S-cluster containining protein
MKPSRMELIEKLYAQIPEVNCQGLCTDSCGPIMYSREERRHIVRKVGKKPLPEGDDLVCSMLHDGRCSIYSIRPLICRLWGATEMLKCPFGCRPERLLTKAEAAGLLRQVCEIGGHDDHLMRQVFERMKAVMDVTEMRSDG